MGCFRVLEEGLLVLICSTCYGLVMSTGLVSVIIGSVVVSDMPGDVSMSSPGSIVMVAGFVNFFVGGAALAGVWYRHWQLLMVVEVCLVLVTVGVIMAAILALCLAMDWDSPIAEAIKRGWNPVGAEQGVRLALDKDTPKFCDSTNVQILGADCGSLRVRPVALTSQHPNLGI